MSLAWPPTAVKGEQWGMAQREKGGGLIPSCLQEPPSPAWPWVTRESSVSLLVSPSALPDPEAQCVCRPLPGKADS